MVCRSGWSGWCTDQSFTTSTGSPIFASRSGKRWARSRSTMLRMIRSSSTGSLRQSMLSTVRPSRSTVMRSATRATSFNLCEIRIEAMPCSLNATSRSSSAALSVSFRLAVGSSRIKRRTRLESAFAISTSCCLPTPRSVTSVSGCSRRPTWASSSRVRRCTASRSIMPNRLGRCDRKMFSAIDISGIRASSWWMMMIPSASESLMSRKLPLLAVEDDRPLIAAAGIDAAEHLHQRRLARAVLAHEGMDLAGLHGEVDVAQRLHACKTLADAAHFKHCRHWIFVPGSCPAAPGRPGEVRSGRRGFPRLPDDSFTGSASACSSRPQPASFPNCSCRPRQA